MKSYQSKVRKPIQLSDHFNYWTLLRFTFPSIVMMLFTSLYSIVDGLFVSNFVGTTGFAAINLIFPALTILATFGFMFGAGGGALIAKTLGEGKREKANQLFSMFVWLSAGLGLAMTLFGFVFMRPIAALLGAEGQLLENSVLYGRIFILALPTWILLYEFQLFFVTAEKPKLGLAVTVAAGVTNIALDALFIIVFHWGLAGAALASAISQMVGGIFPLIYFGRENTSLLKLVKPEFDGRAFLKGCTNGSSELMSGVAMSFVGIIYNIQLLKYVGEDGVAAYGVMMYVSMIFSSVFLGYSSGAAPVVGFHYGAGNHRELNGLWKKSLLLISVFSISMFGTAQLFADLIAEIFVGYDIHLRDMTEHAFRIYSIAYLFMGMAIFSSSFFTALNNGLISAAISFLRTLVFELGAVLLLPVLWGVDGIWASIVVAEFMAMSVGVRFMLARREKYHY